MVRGELSFSLFTDNFIMVVGNGKDVQFLAPNNSVVWPDVSIYSMCLRGTWFHECKSWNELNLSCLIGTRRRVSHANMSYRHKESSWANTRKPKVPLDQQNIRWSKNGILFWQKWRFICILNQSNIFNFDLILTWYFHDVAWVPNRDWWISLNISRTSFQTAVHWFVMVLQITPNVSYTRKSVQDEQWPLSGNMILP